MIPGKSNIRERYLEDPTRALESICPAAANLERFLVEATGGRPVVVGLSGGIDSSLAAALAVRALGPGKVHALMMPSSDAWSTGRSDIGLTQAISFAKKLGIDYQAIPIRKLVETALALKPSSGKGPGEGLFDDRLRLGNLKARLRMILLYDRAKELGALVLGTSNHSEYMTGYFTKWGDGVADIEPILPLFKTHVRMLARELGVPEEIVEKAPSAELWEGQTDEDEMGIGYSTLDLILLGRMLGLGQDQLLASGVASLEELMVVERLIVGSCHKRNLPPSPEVLSLD